MTDPLDAADSRRPLAITLLAALYLFFFLVSASTFGNPFPFMGSIYRGPAAQVLVVLDTLCCCYLFLGLLKQQELTWYLLLGYNLLQIGNTLCNLYGIPMVELEAVTGGQIEREALWTNNMVAALGMLLLTQYIYRHRSLFPNRDRYLF
jgi:hypothetical protein